MSTCQHSFGLLWTRGEWMCSICSYQRRWYQWNGKLPASMESHREVERSTASIHGVPWSLGVEYRYEELVR